MIHGVGIDLVSLQRIEQSFQRFGDAFAEKVLHENEMTEYSKSRNQISFTGKRFAAKEAFLKAIGTGLREGLSFKHIEITHTEQGKPEIQCHNRAAELLQSNMINSIHLSITDEKQHAAAVVVLEKH